MLLTTTILSLSFALVSTESLEPRIIRGKDADRNQFPYIVSLRHSEGNAHFCAGTIITPSWVLTTVHCVVDICYNCHHQPEQVVVVSGAFNLKDEGVKTKIKTIKFPHVENKPRAWSRDIALLEAEKPFNVDSKSLTPRFFLVDWFSRGKDFFNNNVLKPLVNKLLRSDTGKHIIKLGRVSNNVEVIVAGWGRESKHSKKLSNELKYTSLWTIDSDKYCQNNISQVCAEDLCGSGVCFGDIGGPVILQSGGEDVLVGIVEDTYCDPKDPVAFIRVYPSRKWILTQIHDENERKYLE